MNEQDKNTQTPQTQPIQQAPEAPVEPQVTPNAPETVETPKEPVSEPAKAVEAPEKEKKKKDKKEKPKKKKDKKFQNISRGQGSSINLIPPLTDEEEKIEVRKFKLNLSAAYTLLFLIVLSILVLGFNAYQKISLNSRKEALFELEKDLNLRGDLLSYNDEIVRRVTLYKEIEESTFSSKEVVEYWESISQGVGEISSIKLTQGLGFEVAGSADSLSDVARLWYLLANDDRVETVTLETVVKDGTAARFSFEGILNLEKFAANQQ